MRYRDVHALRSDASNMLAEQARDPALNAQTGDCDKRLTAVRFMAKDKSTSHAARSRKIRRPEGLYIYLACAHLFQFANDLGSCKRPSKKKKKGANRN